MRNTTVAAILAGMVLGVAALLTLGAGPNSGPYAANVLPGTVGQLAVYIGPHTLSGTNSSASTINNWYITTNNVDYITVNTNTTVTFITNATFQQNISVSGKASFTQIILTNGFFAATNVWAGASNNVDISIYDQEYASLTPCQFNGIINSSNNLGGEVKMTISDISSSNITVTAAAGFVFASGDTSETITNGHRGIFWINHDPALGGQTNVVFQHF